MRRSTATQMLKKVATPRFGLAAVYPASEEAGRLTLPGGAVTGAGPSGMAVGVFAVGVASPVQPFTDTAALPLDPNTGLPYDPQTGTFVDPRTGAAFNPATGMPLAPPPPGVPPGIDPNTGLPPGAVVAPDGSVGVLVAEPKSLPHHILRALLGGGVGYLLGERVGLSKTSGALVGAGISYLT